MKKQILWAGAAAGLALAAASAAQAQSIDYGSLEQLFNEPVTTSATGSPQRSTEVPVDMTIISSADIKRSGATDIPTILSRVAGVDVLNFSVAQSDVGIRGYNQSRSPRLLVLINGRQVYLDHYGYTDWNAIPVQLTEIRQIEVVRGPNSAIFGFNAVSGVINIITFNPKFDNTNVVSAGAGTNDSSFASVVKTLRLGDKLAVRVSGGVRHEEEWKNTSAAIHPADIHDPSTVQANIDAIAQLAPKVELRMEGSWSNGSSTQISSNYMYAVHRVKTDSIKALLTAETGFGVVEGQAYRNNLDILSAGRRFLSDVTVVSAQDLFKVGANHTFRIGVEYRDNKMDTTSFKGAEVGYKVWAPSAMWNWTVNPKLTLTAAARQDMLDMDRSGPFPVGQRATNADWNRSINETSVNLGAVYKATDVDTLRATYARGVQAPTLIELGGVLIPAGVAGPGAPLITGDPRLEPSIVSNYELTYDRALPALNAKASAKVFYQKTEAVKGQFSLAVIDVPAAGAFVSEIRYQNVGDSEMAGLELAASGKIAGGYHWSADTTYTDVKDKGSVPEAVLILRKTAFEAATPKYRSNLAAGWADAKWSVDAFVHYVSDYSSYNGNALENVPAYATLAGRVAYKLPEGIELAVNGQNLLEDRQPQGKGLTGLQAERRVMFAISKSW